MALLWLHGSSNSEIQAGEQVFGTHCSYNRKKRDFAEIQMRPLSFQPFTHNRKALKMAIFILALPHSSRLTIVFNLHF